MPLLVGSCGWTDETIARCGRFYPRGAKSATERLRHYSRFFPSVEVDSTNYALPSAAHVREWLAVVPRGFVFHVKAFGLFTMRHIAPGALPRDLRAAFLTPGQEEAASLRLAELPTALVDALWQRMNSILEILHKAGALGAVLFQWHVPFSPSSEHMAFVADCRRRLDSRFLMACEFRHRGWYAVTQRTRAPASVGDTEGAAGTAMSSSAPAEGAIVSALNPLANFTASRIVAFPQHAYASIGTDILSASSSLAGTSREAVPGSSSGALAESAASASESAPVGEQPVFAHQKAATLYFLRRLGIINVASDDLLDEMPPPHTPPQPGYRDGRVWIYNDVTNPACAYIRLHRRRGSDRLLSKAELSDWGARMALMAATAAGPPFHMPDPSEETTAGAATAISSASTATEGIAEVGSTDSASASSSSGPTAHTTGSAAVGSGSVAVPAPLAAALAAAASGSPPPPPDHPCWWTRLAGPICYLMGTDWEDQPVINMRGICAAAAAAQPFRRAGAAGAALSASSSSADGGAAAASKDLEPDPVAVPRPLDWASIVREQDRKTGLEAFFGAAKPVAAAATQPDASSSGGTTSKSSTGTADTTSGHLRGSDLVVSSFAHGGAGAADVSKDGAATPQSSDANGSASRSAAVAGNQVMGSTSSSSSSGKARLPSGQPAKGSRAGSIAAAFASAAVSAAAPAAGAHSSLSASGQRAPQAVLGKALSPPPARLAAAASSSEPPAAGDREVISLSLESDASREGSRAASVIDLDDDHDDADASVAATEPLAKRMHKSADLAFAASSPGPDHSMSHDGSSAAAAGRIATDASGRGVTSALRSPAMAGAKSAGAITAGSSKAGASRHGGQASSASGSSAASGAGASSLLKYFGKA